MGGGSRLRQRPRRDPTDATAAVTEGTQHPEALSGLVLTHDWLRRYLAPAMLVVGFRELGEKGALLASLPPVAVVTASAARDVSQSVRGMDRGIGGGGGENGSRG